MQAHFIIQCHIVLYNKIGDRAGFIYLLPTMVYRYLLYMLCVMVTIHGKFVIAKSSFYLSTQVTRHSCAYISTSPVSSSALFQHDSVYEGWPTLMDNTSDVVITPFSDKDKCGYLSETYCDYTLVQNMNE